MLVAAHTPVSSFVRMVKVMRPDAGIKETHSIVPLPCTCNLQMQEAMLRRELSIMTERLGRAQSEAVQLRAEREDMYLQLKDIEAALASGRGERGGPGGWLVPGARSPVNCHAMPTTRLPPSLRSSLLPSLPPPAGAGVAAQALPPSTKALQDQLSRAQAELR